MVNINPDFGESLIEGAIPTGMEPTTQTFWMDVLDNIPSIPASMANLSRRGSNTILYGGRAPGRMPARTWMGQAMRENFTPRSVNRFSSQSIFFNQSNFFGRQSITGGVGYSPFHLSQMGNSMARSVAGQSTGRVGAKVGSMFSGTSMGQAAARSFDNGSTPFVQGGLSRLSAAARVANMSDARYANMLGSTTNQGVYSFLRGTGTTLSPEQLASRRSGSLALASSAGRVGGFMGAARHGMSGYMPAMGPINPAQSAQFLDDAAVFRASSSTAGRAGAARAAGWAADLGLSQGYTARSALQASGTALRSGGGVKLAAKGGTLVAARGGMMAIPGLQLAGAALFARDIAKMVTVGAPHLIGGAIQSYTAGYNRGPFETTYRDTEAAATSRQRGVGAIQNSRLNARSILGNEAGALHQHFQ